MPRPYIGSKDWQHRQLAAERRLPRLRLELQLARGALLVTSVVCACAVLFSCVWFLIPAALTSPLAWVILLSGCAVCAGFCWSGLRTCLVPPREMVDGARQALLKVYGSNTTVDELVETFHWRYKAVRQAYIDWDDGGYDPGDTDGNLGRLHGGGLAGLFGPPIDPGSAPSTARQWDRWLGLAALAWLMGSYPVLLDPGQAESIPALLPMAVAFGLALLVWSLTYLYSSCARSMALVELSRDLSAAELDRRRAATQGDFG